MTYIDAKITREQKKALKAIRAARTKGNLCLFIGAGFSRPFGYPGWHELLRRVASDPKVGFVDTECIEKENPLEIAQVLHYEHSRKKNWQAAKSHLKKRGPAQKSDVQRELDRRFADLCLSKVKSDENRCDKAEIDKLKRLPDLGAKRIFTMNWDCVLETEVYGPGKIQVLRKGDNCSIATVCSLPTLFKLHGDMGAPEGLVFTHTQYFDFLRDAGSLKDVLQETFRKYKKYKVVFLGYSLQDMDVHSIHCDFLYQYGLANRSDVQAYFISSHGHRLGGWRRRFLRTRSIVPVEWAGTLGDFVAALADGNCSPPCRGRKRIATGFSPWDG